MINRSLLASFLLLTVCACSRPQSGPDKTIGGTLLGAGWGAGAGAVIGNQVGSTGPGAAVGAGFGAAAGMINGVVADENEATQIENEQELARLKIQNLSTEHSLASIQHTLDTAIASNVLGGIYQVFFDEDVSSLRIGAIADLETIADTIKSSTYVSILNVVGHSDDAGTPDHNAQLAEARARSVSSYIAARGVSLDQIKVQSFGSQRPIASNTTPVGRQLNRRVDVYISH